MRTIDVRPISTETRQAVTDYIAAHWFGTDMLIRGEIIDMTAVDGYTAMDGGALVGIATYITRGAACEIVSLDSMVENEGIGTRLVAAVAARARELGCARLRLMTTNDNLRAAKPSIPLIGQNGIEMHHEIEFVMNL